MGPVDPPIRVGTTIAPPSAASPTLALDRRISPGSLAVGQELNARLLSDRAGGRFLALIDGRPVEVVLPPGARAGDTLRLTVTAEQPRLVLSGQADARVGTGSGATATAAGADAASPASPDGAQAQPARTATEVSVSAGGRALTRLVADIASAAAGARAPDPDAGATQANRAVPLVALPAAGRGELAGQLAAALARTFSGSGLFYESHQAQWVAGERSLDSLRQEPQGKLPPLPPAAPAASSLAGTPAAQLQGTATEADAIRPAPTTAREGATAPATSGTAAPGAGALAGVVDAASASLVQQQLATLDAGRAGWSGLVLPGVPASIVVQERPAPSEDDAEGTPEPAADWATTVSVVLPRLGAVDARLLLRGDRLLLSVAADEASGADELAAAREQLVSALADAGLKVDAVQVEGSAS